MNVSDITARRDRHRPTQVGRCVCGSEWFTLRGRTFDPDIAEHGAVTISSTGNVTGYCGELRCLECDEVWDVTL